MQTEHTIFIGYFFMSIIIFDLDGTLLNTIADLGEACNNALRKHGFAEHEAEEYPHLVGNGVNKLIERALPEGHKDMSTVLRLRETFVEYYDLHNCDQTKPYDGIHELLNRLKSDGYKLAVASNKYQSAAQKIVEHYFGTEMFDVIFGERDNCPRKPNPQVVEDIKHKLGFTTQTRLYYVGDSDVDMQTAHNAGAPAIGCTWGFCSRQQLLAANPDFLIDHPQELIPIITH